MTPSRGEAPTATSLWSLSESPKRARWPQGRWVGRGDKEGGDGAAVDAMRELSIRCQARRPW